MTRISRLLSFMPLPLAAIATVGWVSDASAQSESAAAPVEELQVDLGSDTGPFHGGASGTLYGLYDERLPFPNLVEGIDLRTVSTKAQDGPQHPGADALEVNRLLGASGGDTYIYMTDIYREFPYAWKTGTCAQTVDAYMAKLRLQAEQVHDLPKGDRDRIVFVPFNEPEGNMFGDGDRGCDEFNWLKDPSVFFDTWDKVVRLLRKTAPGVRIAGPNTAILFDQNYGFLKHVLKAGTMPDVVTWHELSNPSAVKYNVGRYRDWEKRLFAGTPFAGRQLPININEYAYNYHTSVPGQMVQWLAGIEDSKVDADIAYWNIDGNLSDSAVQANRGNGQWWLLNAYTAMKGGHTLAVKPPKPGESYTLQGLATFDPDKRQMRLLFGGASGAKTVRLNNIPKDMGDRLRIAVREIGWSGQIGDSPPPRTIADLTVNVDGGSVMLPFGTNGLPALREESAYEVIATPALAKGATMTDAPAWRVDLEAEDATHKGSGHEKVGPLGSPEALDRFYTSGRYAVGGFASDKDLTLDFAVDVPRDGKYDLSVVGNTFNKDAAATGGATNVFVRVDGKPASEIEMQLPLGYKPTVWDHADTTLALTRGRHILSISTRSLAGDRRTVGNGLIDRITLSSAAEPGRDTAYEAEYAALDNARPVYDLPALSGAGGVRMGPKATTTFWVHADADGPARLALDTARGGGGVSLAVNGEPARAGAEQTVFLLGGINKVVATAPAGTVIDRLRTRPEGAAGRQYEAEAATVAGTAKVEAAARASGGSAVTGIGGDPGNGNTLTFADVEVPTAGRYALTVRYANDEQSQATHYNPDPLARIARISINGAAPVKVTFPHSFNRDNWWELSVPVTLKAGRNTIRFAGEEEPNFDGNSYASQTFPGILLRSRFAPDIDRITVTPLAGGAGTRRP